MLVPENVAPTPEVAKITEHNLQKASPPFEKLLRKKTG